MVTAHIVQHRSFLVDLDVILALNYVYNLKSIAKEQI